jgi:hypothetical protein
MKLLDPDHPFFANRWRRWGTVVLPIAYGGVELYFGYPGWAIVFIGAGIYALWMLFLKRPQG